jgi:3-carboxy-cis,cis-muconate cycloisomerase
MTSRSSTDLYGSLYGTHAMRDVFSAHARIAAMLRFEVALARAEAELDIIPVAAAEAIARAAHVDDFDIDAIAASAENVGYPVVAITKRLAALAGEDAGGYVHWGATTQDVLDTATALQLGPAFDLLRADLLATIHALVALAQTYRNDVMAGRTHLQHALPVTFGYVCALWAAPLIDLVARIDAARTRISLLQFGGAAGTLASLGTRGREVGERMATQLGLRFPLTPWHVDRSAFADAVCTLALVSGSLAKIATDVTLLAQTEVGEVSEPHAPGRGGSSTMPQKRNPISSEYVIAAARGVAALVPLALGAMAGDHQRATGPWQAEEIALPQSFILASAAFAQARTLAAGMTVDTARMRENLLRGGGLIMAESVSMALAERVGHGGAHALVERASSYVYAQGGKLLDALAADADVTTHLDRATLEKLTDPAAYLGDAGALVDRVAERAATLS